MNSNLACIDLVQKVKQRLVERNLMLVTAESCTGGAVAVAMTDLPGSGQVFERGFVTYSLAAKQQLLGVHKSTLDTYGAVSEETACEMAEGALRNSQAQVSMSITGVAGPTSEENKPVGRVCFAWKFLATGKLTAATHDFSGDRMQIRQQAVAYALAKLLEKLTT